MKIAGVILAGGESSRMGMNKSQIVLRNGRTMLEQMIAQLQPIVDEIIVAGGTEINCSLGGVKSLSDLHPHCGPISGIETALTSNYTDAYLIVACDQPLLTTSLLAKLISEVKKTALVYFKDESGNCLDPFPGLYPSIFSINYSTAIADQNFSIRRIAASLPTEWIEISNEEAAQLKSFNTPQDLADYSDLFLINK